MVRDRRDARLASLKGADTVITMLPAGKHVLGVWGEVVPAMNKGALIIDCSTIDVESSKQAHALAAKHGMGSVDAPVSGGTGGAKGATLTFMCGGDDKSLRSGKARPGEDGQEDRALRRRRRRAGRQDLQQHGARHLHDCGRRGLCAGREARSVASGGVRRGVDVVGPVLGAHQLLPGARVRCRRLPPTTTTSRALPRR